MGTETRNADALNTRDDALSIMQAAAREAQNAARLGLPAMGMLDALGIANMYADARSFAETDAQRCAFVLTYASAYLDEQRDIVDAESVA